MANMAPLVYLSVLAILTLKVDANGSTGWTMKFKPSEGWKYIANVGGRGGTTRWVDTLFSDAGMESLYPQTLETKTNCRKLNGLEFNWRIKICLEYAQAELAATSDEVTGVLTVANKAIMVKTCKGPLYNQIFIGDSEVNTRDVLTNFGCSCQQFDKSKLSRPIWRKCTPEGFTKYDGAPARAFASTCLTVNSARYCFPAMCWRKYTRLSVAYYDFFWDKPMVTKARLSTPRWVMPTNKRYTISSETFANLESPDDEIEQLGRFGLNTVSKNLQRNMCTLYGVNYETVDDCQPSYLNDSLILFMKGDTINVWETVDRMIRDRVYIPCLNDVPMICSGVLPSGHSVCQNIVGLRPEVKYGKMPVEIFKGDKKVPLFGGLSSIPYNITKEKWDTHAVGCSQVEVGPFMKKIPENLRLFDEQGWNIYTPSKTSKWHTGRADIIFEFMRFSRLD